MQMFAFMRYCLSGSLLSAVSASVHYRLSLSSRLMGAELSFNPIKLLCLIGWVYLCLYFVQRVQFSPLVPEHRKSIANIVTLFVGPILLFVLMIVDMVRKYSEGGHSVLEIITDQIQSRDSTIRLFDSSGKSVKQTYSSQVLGLTKRIISKALKQQASDILIHPMDESNYTVRFRVAGLLREVEQIEANMCQAVINSIKTVSSMDISGTLRAQEGAFVAKTANGTTSFRVANTYVPNGEKLLIRVLNQDVGKFTLTDIGLSEKQCTIIENAIAKPSGMVLICGPPGSGKTTTLYAMLNKIDFFTHNVATVESPIEYVLPNASQIAVNPKAGITFANALRDILRKDPDIVCVGEIQDEETAGIALQASQTGHLVLATIRSDNDEWALGRLLGLGVPPQLLSTGLSLIISQRLVNRLCRNCKAPAELSQSQIHDLRRRGISYKNISQANGCKQCQGTGYRGKAAIFDILVLDDKLKASIANSDLLTTQLIRSEGKKSKSNLQKQGLKMVVSGITSLEELKRVVG